MNVHVKSNHLFKLSCILSAALAGSGCMAGSGAEPGQHDGPDQPVGVTQQAFSGYWTWGAEWSAPGSPQVLATDSDKTCFLSGVSGNLKSWVGYEGGGPAIAHVYDDGTNWTINASPGFADSELGTFTTCVPSTTNRTAEQEWPPYDSSEAVLLGAVTANRACFLTGVGSNLNYTYVGDFGLEEDYVYVFHDTDNWYIGGNGAAMGWAECVDVSWLGSQGEVDNEGSSTYTWDMVQHIDHGTDPLGMQCMLQGVGGIFQTNDWTDGVFVNYEDSNFEWSLSVSPSQSAWVNCVQ
jgi:hypothetical protein